VHTGKGKHIGGVEGSGEELGMIWIRRCAWMGGGTYGQGDMHMWRGDAYASITNKNMKLK
jgi:hypothetical protein